MFPRIQKIAGLAIVALTLSTGIGASTAEAAHYRYVTKYVNRLVPFERTIIRFDHCGCPYYKTITDYKTVRVAVKVRVYCD